MSDNTIEAVDVMGTDFGKKVVFKSPYESRFYIKHLPWQEYGEEVAEYGSLKEKAEARGTNTKTSQLMQVFDDYEEFGFSSDFATHMSWEPDALGPDTGAWTVDKEAWEEFAEFFEFAGYNVDDSAIDI